MATRMKFTALVLAVAATWNVAPSAMAVDPPDLFLEHLADFVWTGAGDGVSWQDPNNWTAPDGHMGEFPDDPNRIDDPVATLNITTINSVEGANLSAH